MTTTSSPPPPPLSPSFSSSPLSGKALGQCTRARDLALLGHYKDSQKLFTDLDCDLLIHSHSLCDGDEHLKNECARASRCLQATCDALDRHNSLLDLFHRLSSTSSSSSSSSSTPSLHSHFRSSPHVTPSAPTHQEPLRELDFCSPLHLHSPFSPLHSPPPHHYPPPAPDRDLDVWEPAPTPPPRVSMAPQRSPAKGLPDWAKRDDGGRKEEMNEKQSVAVRKVKRITPPLGGLAQMREVVEKSTDKSSDRLPRAPLKAPLPAAAKGLSKPVKAPMKEIVREGAGARKEDIKDETDSNQFQPLEGEKELAEYIESAVLSASPGVLFSDIGGMDQAKQIMQEHVVNPLKMPEVFKGLLAPSLGVLLFGPPGTGKTMLARAVATECQAKFFNITSSNISSKWRGESEKLVTILFKMARHYAPSIIFFDEIDALGGERGAGSESEGSRRVKTELLTQMDGMNVDPDKFVMVIAATNLPWEIDTALRRRLEKRVYVPLPDQSTRLELFRLNLRGANVSPDVSLDQLAKDTDNYSGADIKTVCRTAAYAMLRDPGNLAKLSLKTPDAEKPFITKAHFETALLETPASNGKSDMTKFQQWMTQFGSGKN